MILLFSFCSNKYVSSDHIKYVSTLINKEDCRVQYGNNKDEYQKKRNLIDHIKYLHKNNLYQEAKREIENVFNSYYCGELYYIYADTLYKLNKFEDSANAYIISSITGYNNPELALYNASCIFSEINQIEKSLDYLYKALDRGYNNLSYIKKDKDLENLRKSYIWKKNISKISNKIINLKKIDIVNNLIVFPGPSASDLYLICPNGKAFSSTQSYGCNPYLNEGEWIIKNGELIINFAKEYLSQGKGKITYSNCGNVFESYIYNGNKKIKEDIEISRSQIAIIFGRKYYGMDDSSNYYRPYFQNIKNAKQCSDNFQPDVIDDIDIVKYIDLKKRDAR